MGYYRTARARVLERECSSETARADPLTRTAHADRSREPLARIAHADRLRGISGVKPLAQHQLVRCVSAVRWTTHAVAVRRLRGSRLRGSRFRGFRLRGSRFRGFRLRGIRLRGRCLFAALPLFRFHGSRLRGICLFPALPLFRLSCRLSSLPLICVAAVLRFCSLTRFELPLARMPLAPTLARRRLHHGQLSRVCSYDRSSFCLRRRSGFRCLRVDDWWSLIAAVLMRGP